MDALVCVNDSEDFVCAKEKMRSNSFLNDCGKTNSDETSMTCVKNLRHHMRDSSAARVDADCIHTLPYSFAEGAGVTLACVAVWSPIPTT